MAEFTEANRKYFDQMATAYKDRFANVMRILSEETLKRRSWISDHWTDSGVGMGKGKEIKMLEYACGPGVISMTLAPYLTKVIGFDVSDNMVSEFNRNAESLGFSDRMTAYNADLLAERVPEEYAGPDFYNLDVVAISMALHHFEHPGLALKRLAPRLRKGGVCYIIDFVPHSGHDHGHAHSHNQNPGDGPGHGGQHDHDHKHHHHHDHDHKHGPGHGDKPGPGQERGGDDHGGRHDGDHKHHHHDHDHDHKHGPGNGDKGEQGQGPGNGHDHGGKHDHDHKHHHDHDRDHDHGPGHGGKPGQEHGSEFGDAAHTVKTHGFSKEDMKKLFEGAGLTLGFDYQELPEPLVFNKEDKTFSKAAFVARVQRE